MDPKIIGLFTLLGVFFGGVINYILLRIKINQETERQKQELFRIKLEEICQVVEQVRQGYIEATIDIRRGIEDRELRFLKAPLPLARLSMLIDTYAPMLKNNLEQFYEVQELFEEIATLILDSIKNMDTQLALHYYEKLNLANRLVKKLCKALTNAAVITINNKILNKG